MTNILLVTVLLISSAAVATGGVVEIHQPDNILKLGKSLELFEACTVQVIVFTIKGVLLEELDDDGDDANYTLVDADPNFNFEVAPLEFPILLSAPMYNYYNSKNPLVYNQEGEETSPSMSCGSTSQDHHVFNLEMSAQNDQVSFPKTPPHSRRQLCSVQVFIPPKVCDKEWSLQLRFDATDSDHEREFPKWLFTPYHDFSFGKKKLGSMTFPRVDQFQIQIVQQSLLLESFEAVKVIEDFGVYGYKIKLDFILMIDMFRRKPRNAWYAPDTPQETSLYTTPTKILFVLDSNNINPNDGLNHQVGGGGRMYVYPHFEIDAKVDFTLTRMSDGLCNTEQYRCQYSLPEFRKYSFDPTDVTLKELQQYQFRHVGSTTWIVLDNDISTSETYEAPYMTKYLVGNFSPERIILDSLSQNSSWVPKPSVNHFYKSSGRQKSYLTPTVELESSSTATSYLYIRYPPHSLYFITTANIDDTARLRLGLLLSTFDDWPAWLALILSGAASGVVVVVVVQISTIGKSSARRFLRPRYTFGNHLIMMIMPFHSTTVIHKKCKLLCGACILVAILLWELHKGRTFQELTAPLPKSGLETFTDLIDHQLTIYSNLTIGSNIRLAQWDVLLENIKSEGLPLNSIVTELDEFLMADNYGQMDKSTVIKLIQQVYRPGGLEERRRMTQENYFLKVVSSEGSRNAYADIYDRVMGMYHDLVKLGIATRDISVSREGFGSSFYNMQFRNTPFPTRIFMTRLRSLAHSGIADLWENWFERVFTWEDTVNTATAPAHFPHKLTLLDDFVIVFYLFLCLLLVSLTIFVIEAWEGLRFAFQTYAFMVDHVGQTLQFVVRPNAAPVEAFTE